ncbi:MAG: ABC transporter permease, partial [Longimicrobiales bacterium]
MSKRNSFRRTFRLSDHAPEVGRDVDDELSLYLELRERELIEAGSSPEQARRAAREAFGDAAAIASEVRRLSRGRVRRWRARGMAVSMMQDVRFGLRGLRLAPAFASAAILTLALGIGANAMVFGLIEAMLLRSPAVRAPDQLVAVYTTCRRGDPRCSSSYPDYRDYRDRTRAFADVAAYNRSQVILADGERAELMTAEITTGNYFELLGVSAAQGRLLGASDNEPGGESNVVVLSDAVWRTRFGGETRVIGRTIRLNEMPHTVIGIAPPSFSGLRLGDAPDVWVPLRGMLALFPNIVPTLFEDRGSRWISGLVARLADGATIERARAELRAVSDQLALEDPDARGPRTVTVDPLPRYILPAGNEQTIVQFASVLQAVVALTLLLACANLANLLLARAAARQREMGIRAAIGACRGRIVGQLLTESGLLAAAGAIAGLLLAAIGLRLVSGFRLPFNFDVAALEPAVNARVIVYTMALTIGTVLLFGVLPALHASRGELATLLRQSRTDGRPRARRPLSVLVGVQVALCVVLLTGAGLFVRTLRNHLQADLGFNAAGVATVTVEPWMHRYTAERTASLIHSMETSMALLPGVVSAGTGARVPVRAGGGAGVFIEVEGYVPAPDEELRIEYNFVTQDYFRTLGIPV